MALDSNTNGMFKYAGIPISPDRHTAFGNCWFVDGNQVSGDGKKPDSAFTTIAAAISAASSYDTIYLLPAGDLVYNTNDYTESVTVPYLKPGLRFIGCANNHMEGILWTPVAADNHIVSLKSRDCYFEGIRFRPNGTNVAAIHLNKWVGSGTKTDASGLTVKKCSFRSTGTDSIGLLFVLSGGNNEGANDVWVEDCIFSNMAKCLYCNTPATVPSRTTFRNVIFESNCTVGIQHSCRRSLFENCLFQDMSGMLLDTDMNGGAAAADNVVFGCHFGNAATQIEEINAGSTDCWMGSTFGNPADCTDNVETNGKFILNPDGATGTG